MIQQASAENFLPFRNRVEYPVASLGLVLVRGENRVSAAADSNGVGKSALLSVMAFARYGRTLCGRSADEVVNRFSKGRCVVESQERDDLTGEFWKVVRSRRPASVELYRLRAGEGNQGKWQRFLEDADAKDVDAWVEAHTQPWRVFRNAMVFDRFERFSRADAGDQMRMLDVIQGVDFRAALERAKQWRSTARESASAARAAAMAAETAIEEARSSVAGLVEVRDSFRRDIQARVAEAEDERGAAQDAFEMAAARVQRIGELERELADAVEEAERYDSLFEDHREATTKLGEVDRAATDCGSKLDGVLRQIEELRKAGLCGQCRRPVKKGDAGAPFAAEVAFLEKALKAHKADRDKAWKKLAKTKDALDEFLGKRTAAQLDGAVRRLQGETSESAKRLAEQVKRDSRARLRAAEQAVEKVRSEKWAGIEALDAAQARVEELDGDLRRERAEAEKHERFAAISDYCVEAFGDRGVRAMLADGVGGYIMQRASVHLEELAAGEALMTVGVTVPKGSSKERLTVVPEWAWGGVGKAAESAGQDCRSDLALFAAMQDLSEASSPRPFGMKAFDEPDGLDARGLELFGSWIGAEARRRGTAFLVTHRGELANAVDPDEQWTVVLEGPGDARLVRE